MPIADLRNKLGNVVYSRNRYGAYSREYVIPIDPSTTYQDAVRASLAVQTVGWQGLTDAQRTAWNDAIPSFLHTDVFANIIRPSGFNLYVKLNFNLNQIGFSSLTIPPVPASTFPVRVSSATISLAGVSMSVVFAISPIPADYYAVIYATTGLSSSINYFRNKLRQTAILTDGETTPYNLYAEYVTRFGVPVLGKKIGFAIESIHKTTGQKSPRSYASGIVEA